MLLSEPEGTSKDLGKQLRLCEKAVNLSVAPVE